MNDESRFTLDPDGDSSWLVMDNGIFIGGIHHIGEHEFLAIYVMDGKPFGPVPVGPHRTLEAALDAFTMIGTRPRETRPRTGCGGRV